MQKSHEESRLGVLIGPDFEGQGRTFGKFSLDFFERKATEQLQKLSTVAGGQLDIEWSVVACLSALPGQGQKLLDGILLIYEEVQKKSGDQAIFKTVLEGDKLYLSIKALPEVEGEIMEPFNMFFAQGKNNFKDITTFCSIGLDSVSSEQENSLRGSLNSNLDFSDFFAGLVGGERFLSMVWRSLKLEIFLNMHKALAAKLRDIAQNFDPSFATEPPMVFFQKFKNFDIDLRFKSSNDLPETIRTKVLFGEYLQKHEGDNQIPLEKLQGFKQVVDTLGSEHEFWGTIPNFLAANVTVNLPGLSQVVENYGKGIVKMFDQI